MKRWYDGSVGVRLTRAARLHRAHAQAVLADIGLHPGQEAVLQALQAEDGQLMTRLAEALRVKPPTVTKMVARMAGQGLVRRIASPSDARSAHVYLTDAGRERALALKTHWKALEARTLSNLSGKDRRRLLKALAAIEAALGAEPGLPAEAQEEAAGGEDGAA